MLPSGYTTTKATDVCSKINEHRFTRNAAGDERSYIMHDILNALRHIIYPADAQDVLRKQLATLELQQPLSARKLRLAFHERFETAKNLSLILGEPQKKFADTLTSIVKNLSFTGLYWGTLLSRKNASNLQRSIEQQLRHNTERHATDPDFMVGLDGPSSTSHPRELRPDSVNTTEVVKALHALNRTDGAPYDYTMHKSEPIPCLGCGSRSHIFCVSDALSRRRTVTMLRESRYIASRIHSFSSAQTL